MVLIESIVTSPRIEHTLTSPKLASFGSPRMARRMSASSSPSSPSSFGSPLSPRLRHFKLLHSIPHPGCRLGTAVSHTTPDEICNRKTMPASPELHDAWVNIIGPKLSPVDIVVLSTVNKWGHATAHSIMTHQGSVKWNTDNLKDLTTLEHVAKHWPHMKMELDVWENGCALKSFMDEECNNDADENAVSSAPTPASPSSSSSSSAARTAAGAAALARAMAVSNTDSALHVQACTHTPALAATQMVDTSKPVWPVCQVALLRLVWCPVSRFDFVDPSRLEQFHRVGPKLGMEARKSLEQMLLGCTRLEALTLSNCIDSEDDVKWLANALGRLTRLSHLDLRCNYLEGDRAETLAPALAQLTNITSLDLGVNAFGAEGMQHLAPSLAKMTRMKELILQYNCMGTEGAKAVAPALAHMPQLTGLYLGENGMGAEGVQAIVPMLPHMPLLTHVNIEVRALGVEARAGVRKMLPSVRDVDLW